MGYLEKILEDPKYNSYKALKNYVLFREECLNKEGILEKIKIYPEIIEQYISAYEFEAHMHLNSKYKNYEKIISSKKEKVTFDSKRPDGIRVQLFCHAKAIELILTAEPESRKDESLYSISTVLGQYNAPETYSVSYVTLTKEGITISQEGLKMPMIIRQKIVDNNYGFIPSGLFPKE